MSFEEACDYLFPRTGGGAKWSLGPTRSLLDKLGHPEQQFRTIHIAGTNGKGSVAAMVHSVLRASGHSVGLYTSPHLLDVTERIKVNETPLGRQMFAGWTEFLKDDIESEDASFFEATTAIAAAHFVASGVDLAVVEVGLGGRLDSTNILDPLVTAVTTVGLDHSEFLGPTLRDIAAEKAGIAKPGVPMVVGVAEDDLKKVVCHTATELGATVVDVPSGVRYEGPLGLKGEHQRRNGAIARVILEQLPSELVPDPSSVAEGLGSAWLPGRFDRRGHYIFDVAHNVEATGALVDALRSSCVSRPLNVLVGILGDKDLAGMLRALEAIADDIWLSIPPSAPENRRLDLDHFGVDLGPKTVVMPDFEQALALADERAGTLLVTGSFHTVGDAMSLLPGFTSGS